MYNMILALPMLLIDVLKIKISENISKISWESDPK